MTGLIFPFCYREGGLGGRTPIITAYWPVNHCLCDHILNSGIHLGFCYRKDGLTAFTLTAYITFPVYGAAWVMVLSRVIVVVSAQLRY